MRRVTPSTPHGTNFRTKVFTYQCTDCRSKNKTENPPEDCMLHCVKCGILTVQACVGLEARR